MKVYLCDLVHEIPGTYVVPLNIAYIAAYSNFIFDNELEVSLFKYPNELLNAVEEKPPHILGLSNYSWNYDLNCQIGRHIKRSFPSIVIAMGGPGIRTDIGGIKAFLETNEYVDVYMMFEGEQPFVNFVSVLRELNDPSDFRKLRKQIKGCAYLTGERNLSYAPHELISDLDKIPSPYLNGYLDYFLKQGLIPLLETNRGCPFSCTFCSWGISALKKVRKFPLERTYDEIEYIASKYPELPLWIFADANFGLFPRDELIAKKIKELKDGNSSLRRVLVWSTKNNPERNLKISKYLNNLEGFLIAVQSFDEVVLENVNRSNIKLDDISSIIKKAKAQGAKVATDILLGLPGETKESHLESLRKAFEFGFDEIAGGEIRLLPGSELETHASRQKYNIKTKCRLIHNAYGIYRGIKSLEAEEVVRSTSTMTEEEMVYFRLVRWPIWFGLNCNFLSPLIRYLRFKNVNPLDLIVGIVNTKKGEFPLIDDLFNRLRKDAEEEWFANRDDLRDYYTQDEHFAKLLNGGFSKLNFKYTAELIVNRHTYMSFIDFIEYVTLNNFSASCPISSDLFNVIKQHLIDIYEVNRNSTIHKKKIALYTDLVPFVAPLENFKKPDKRQFVNIVLFKEDEHIEALKKLYKKFNFNVNRQMAIERILEYFLNGFTYSISVEAK